VSEERAAYAVPNANSSQWYDIRFADGRHTGVRVLRSTSIIEVQRDGRKMLFNISECEALTNRAILDDK